MIELNCIHVGNNLDLLRQMPDNSVDSVVTDPPYGINFMNKKWDYDVPNVETWKEVLRVLKPGGHALVACGTRTQHRMAVNIEDGGFEIRDIVAWIYGSGFPKSMDVEKALDKGQGQNRQRQLEFTTWMRGTGITAEQINEATMTNMASHYLTDKQQPAIATADLFDKLRPYLPEVPEKIEKLVAERTGIEWTEYKNRKVTGQKQVMGKTDTTCYGAYKGGIVNITLPSTEAAKQWQGWGTALKPAMELWTLARKPIKGTVAENVLKYGTGGLNIDGCRVGEDFMEGSCARSAGEVMKTGLKSNYKSSDHLGRFPANLIHDGSEEVVKLFPSEDGEQSASRFFYTAKASQAERNDGLWGFEEISDNSKGNGLDRVCEFCGVSQLTPELCQCEKKSWVTKLKRNTHPTVKPIELMRYLCRLITPKGGIVLDPYCGSGSTCIAAKQEKMQYIGMELEEQYVKIAEARIKAADVQYDIFDFLDEPQAQSATP